MTDIIRSRPDELWRPNEGMTETAAPDLMNFNDRIEEWGDKDDGIAEEGERGGGHARHPQGAPRHATPASTATVGFPITLFSWKSSLGTGGG